MLSWEFKLACGENCTKNRKIRTKVHLRVYGKWRLQVMGSWTCNVPVNSKTDPPPPPQAIPGHLTRVKLRKVGNFTQNEARPVEHLTFVSKCLSAVGSKRISQFFDSAHELRSWVIALVDSTWVFLLLWFYVVISWNRPLFKVLSKDNVNKKFVVAENFADLFLQLL